MEQKTVAVAMSGGVDSSLVAALLQRQGYRVIGLTMRLSDESREGGGFQKMAEDAKGIADGLGIPHEILDFREIFQEKVIQYFLNEYALGHTPNPCVRCNREIKFGALWQYAKNLGADYIATGHYARIMEENGRFLLKKGLDEQKDQSYVLYHLSQEILGHLLLPLGNTEKTETRKMAQKMGLSVAQKPESQEICFIPHDDYKAYLRAHLPEALQAGNIVDESGNVLGKHEGVPLYTIGQRKGLGIAAEHPLYVSRLDTARKEVVVGGADHVFSMRLCAKRVNWIPFDLPHEPMRAEVKIRYGKRQGSALLTPLAQDRVCVQFDEPQRAITAGQSAVFYRGDVVLGGGIIEEQNLSDACDGEEGRL